MASVFVGVSSVSIGAAHNSSIASSASRIVARSSRVAGSLESCSWAPHEGLAGGSETSDRGDMAWSSSLPLNVISLEELDFLLSPFSAGGARGSDWADTWLGLVTCGGGGAGGSVFVSRVGKNEVIDDCLSPASWALVLSSSRRSAIFWSFSV